MKKFLTLALTIALLLTAASCGSEETAPDSPSTEATTTASSDTVTTTVTPPQTQAPDDDEDDYEDDYEEDLTDFCDAFIPYGSAAIDGVKDDAWSQAITFPVDKVKKDSPAADTVVNASVMWDENGLYFLFEITDSDIFTTGALGDYNNDGIYLYVSEDENSTIANLSDFYNGVYQFALTSADNEILPRKGNVAEVSNAISAYTLTDTGMIIEFSYTPTVKPNAAGNFLLMDFQYNDSGASGVRKGNLGWYNGTDTNGTPSMWGLVKLLAQGETAPF